MTPLSKFLHGEMILSQFVLTAVKIKKKSKVLFSYESFYFGS